jgi:phenylalanyl-tRNA synthetase beta subunit
MHAFDADKVVGTITTRFANSGESLTTLDGKLVVLDETVLVLADDEGPLDIAGIKGGTKAEVDRNTKNIVLVSSNFNSTLIRKTTQKVGIKTDAAKRFENGITSELCAPALLATLELVLKCAKTDATQISHITDIYPHPESWIYKVGLSLHEVNRILGTELTDTDIEKLLSQREFKYRITTLTEVLETEVDRLLGAEYSRVSNMRQDAPERFSCSSLVSYLYTLAGIPMPSISVDKYVFGAPVLKEDLALGDLIFSNTGEGRIYTETVEYKQRTPVPEGVDHVGIYMGQGKVLHASKTINGVGIEEVSSAENFKNIVGYRRIASDSNQKRYVVEIPAERLDIRIKEDIVDEIGKLIGTEHATPSFKYDNTTKGSVSKSTHYSALIRNLLIEEGYSEVMTTSFSNEGDIAILNSVDPKKNHLRTTLFSGMIETLDKGLYYSAFLGPEEMIKVFEIGNVFADGKEKTNIAIGAASKNKKIIKELKNSIRSVSEELFKKIGLTSMPSLYFMGASDGRSEIIEFTIDTFGLYESSDDNIFSRNDYKSDTKYQTLSNYPFITRDVAVFVPGTEPEDSLEKALRDNAGQLAVKIYQFDKFQKEGDPRVSYGYRMVFQAFDRTLTDVEVEPSMQEVYKVLKEKGWEVR